jgi:hypothetical protein
MIFLLVEVGLNSGFHACKAGTLPHDPHLSIPAVSFVEF